MLGNITSSLLVNSTEATQKSSQNTTSINAKETITLKQDFNVNKKFNDLLKSLSSDLIDGRKSQELVLDLLKNSNLFKNLTKMSKTLDSLIADLKLNPKLESQAKLLEQFSVQIKDLDGTKLKQQVHNSGIFFESKLKDISQVDIKKDIKYILLQIQKELLSSDTMKDIETLRITKNLLTQIDLNQLQSLTGNNISLYIPFIWDMCDDANIEFNNTDKDIFKCNIRLKLKGYGDMNLSLILHDINKIDLSFYTKTSDFKELIRDNMQDLKKKISEIGLIISSIKLLDLNEEKNPYLSSKDISLDLDIIV